MIFSTLIGVLGAVLLAGAFSGSETGNYLLNHVRLRYRCEQGQATAIVLQSVLRDPQLFIFTTLVGHNLAVYIASTLTTNFYIERGVAHSVGLVWGFLPWNAEVAATMTLMLPIFLFAEVGPKNLFRKRANSLMYGAAHVLRVAYLLFLPITVPLRQLARLVRVGVDADAGAELVMMSRRRLRAFFHEGASEGVLTPHQSTMASNVMALRHHPVSEAMEPLATAPCLPESATVADFRALLASTDTNRVLLYRDQRTEIVGGVHMFDVMGENIAADAELRPFLRPVVSVTATAPLHEAFYRLRRHHQSMAVVVDDRGRAQGLVTIEAITQRIVG